MLSQSFINPKLQLKSFECKISVLHVPMILAWHKAVLWCHIVTSKKHLYFNWRLLTFYESSGSQGWSPANQSASPRADLTERFYGCRNDPEQIGWMLINGDCRAGGTGGTGHSTAKASKYKASWIEDLADMQYQFGVQNVFEIRRYIVFLWL